MASISSKCQCGSKGKRDCPARGERICPSCCASKRISEIVCPETCSYNTFSKKNYNQQLDISNALDRKSIRYLGERVGEDKFYETIREIADEIDSEEANEILINSAAYMQLMFYEAQSSGLTVFEEWEKQDLKGLSNDERIIMKQRRDAKATIIEVDKILKDSLIECRDLLNPKLGIFQVIDKSYSKQALRYDRFLVRIEKGPFFSTLSIMGTKIPPMIREQFIPQIRQIAKELTKQDDGESIKSFLTYNLVGATNVLYEMCKVHTEAMLSRMDFHHCIARYKIAGDYKEVANILIEKPEFKIIDDYTNKEDCIHYDWLRIGDSKKIEKKMNSAFHHKDDGDSHGVLGSVKLYNDTLEIEIMSKKKYKFAKQIIKKYFKDLITFTAEKIEDSAKQMASRMSEEAMPSDEECVKPKSFSPEQEKIPIEDAKEMMTRFYKKNYEQFLDDKIPMLGNITPRQAAKDPNKRNVLIDLMKIHLNGLESIKREKGIAIDIDWMLDELSLFELK